MAADNIYRLIQIDALSQTPKYVQLINSIVKAIEHGKIEKGYLLPSINDLSYELDVSRDTAEKTYRQLKKLGIVGSVPGKGYFISKTNFKHPLKILLMFNKLSVHKKIIYDAFVSKLSKKSAIDLYIYNNDFNLFKKILLERHNHYTHFVIIPHFLEGGESLKDILNVIAEGNLILLDKTVTGITRQYGAVYENFENDIFEALKKALIQLQKYKTLKIVFPSNSYFPIDILNGFKFFCKEYAFNYKIIHQIAEEKMNEGEAYINLMEDDLIVLLEKIKSSKLNLGKDIGIISYNETPWKQFILEGITTISTDFKKMGELAAKMVMKNENKRIEVPFSLTLRNSL